ncbi:receptor-type tyrosine-protein phosphatase T isoform X4 [Lingula anatina]|uniref:protein-tyrosine-phosphatase n=1 Tax=Lingula anatina TaxID=7574 RepID=A0A2R2MNK9_LINAN|nr:receptor-type tyrosine-protein phosphatase T isoform X4 [Lingula anatina]|eukprot:XP_023931632.1 receptor-type tyrosine-protein phosphatase T isoform X4 [Lingula anatina]
MAERQNVRALHIFGVFLVILCIQGSAFANCPSGRYGWRCRYECQCQDGVECDQTTGECVGGCQDDRWGPGCILDSNCYYDDHDGIHYTGKKTLPNCVRWDSGSPIIYSNYRNASYFPDKTLSDAANLCRNPSENPWNEGPWCYTESVSRYTSCSLRKCDCPAFRFGINCRSECHCSDEEEDCSLTGICSSGCADGWKGGDCQTATITLRKRSNRKGCEDDRYGENCQKACMCRNPAHCNKEAGPTEECQCIRGYYKPQGQLGCQPVTPPRITYFENEKANPGQSAKFTCIAFAKPAPQEEEIHLMTPRGKTVVSSESQLVTDTVRERSFVVDKVNPREVYRCNVSTEAGFSIQNTTAYSYELPTLNATPVVRVDNNKITLSWRKWNEKDDQGDGPIVEYTVETATHIKMDWRYEGDLNRCFQQCHYFMSKVQVFPNTRYFFRVIPRREGEGGRGNPSPVAEYKTPCDAPSEAPILGKLNSSYNNFDKTKITAIWKLPSPASYNCDNVEKQIVYISTSPMVNGEAVLLPGKQVSVHFFNRLVPYTKYYIRVQFENNAQLRSPVSNVEAIITPEHTPGKPRNVNVSPKDGISLIVRWDAPEPPGGEIIQYQVAWWLYGATDQQRKNVTINYPATRIRETVLKDLHPHTKYGIGVRAKTIKGYGPWTDTKPHMTDETLPGPPYAIRNSSRSNTLIVLAWQPPTYLGGTLRDYYVACIPHALTVSVQDEKGLIQRYLNVERRSQEARVAPQKNSAVVDNLSPGTKYRCSVNASTSKGFGPAISIDVWTYPKQPVAPSVPQIIKEETTDTTISVNLQPALDDVGLYRLVVERLPKKSNRRRRSITVEELNTKVSLPDYFEAMKHNMSHYLAAEFPARELRRPRRFVVGNGKKYGGYYNAPLEKGSEYSLWFGAGSSADGITVFTYSKAGEPMLAQVFVPPPKEAATGETTIGIAVAVIVIAILVAALVAAIFMRRRKRHQSKELLNSSTETEKSPQDVKGISIDMDSTQCTDSLLPNGEPPEYELASEPLYDNVTKDTTPIRQPIEVEKLYDYVMAKRDSTTMGFKQEYELLPSGFIAQHDVASKIENKHKNRYGNIIAYDHSRVVLEPYEGDPLSDYINANYIDGYKDSKAYIATQGPSKVTLADWWRMIWQENVSTVVMVTNLVEGGRAKCEQYWPRNDKTTYGEITVEVKQVEIIADYTIRTFELNKGNESKVVKQFHFTTWPDHGVPIFATSLLAFHRKVKAYHTPQLGPMVLHCSAGVGRSGTFIALDYLLDQAKVEGVVDIFNTVHLMRKQRVKMIQTLEQYIFLHDALLEALLSGNTGMFCTDMRHRYNNLLKVNPATGETEMDAQFDLLNKLTSSIPREPEKTSGRDAKNANKNRVPDMVPANHARPHLMTPLENKEGTDYINAAFIDGFRKRDALIITQMPLQHTAVDFWRMIHDHMIFSIVMLNEMDSSDESCVPYWPEQAEPQEYGPFKVEMVSSNMGIGMITRDFKLTHKRQSADKFRIIRQFQYTCWSKTDSVPQSMPSLLALLSAVEKWQQQTRDRTIVVHCMDGASQSGVFCAMYYIMDKIKTQQELDVYHTVNHLRINRKQLIKNKEQYRFCYDFALAYLDSFEPYANFK